METYGGKDGHRKKPRARFVDLLTGGDIEIDIDEAFVVNIKFLRKVLKTISSGKDKWWVEKELAESMVFGHSGADDAEMPQVAPLLIRYPKISAGMVCLHWTAWKTVQAGQYRYDGRTVDDPAEIDRFFRPLEKWLAKYYLHQQEKARLNSLVYREVKLKERPVTLEDCIRSDDQHLSNTTQKIMMMEFLSMDCFLQAARNIVQPRWLHHRWPPLCEGLPRVNSTRMQPSGACCEYR